MPAEMLSAVEPVPLEAFGQDHWSTFAYLCCTIVGNDGVPEIKRMRCHADRHPHFAHLPSDVARNPPTRLSGGDTLKHHDDLDCADDLIAAGLLVSFGTGLHPVFDLTDDGWRALRALLAHRRAAGSGFSSFRWSPRSAATTIDPDGGRP